MRVPLFVLVVLTAAACGTTPEPTPDAGEVTADAGATTPDAGETTPDAGEVTPDAGGVNQAFGGPITYEVAVAGGGFEIANVDRDQRPLTFAYDITVPADAIARNETYASAGISGPVGGGASGFHLRTHLVDSTGDARSNKVVVSCGNCLGPVLPGATYELNAWLYHPGSAGWSRGGPDLGFVVDNVAIPNEVALGTLTVGEWKKVTVTYVGTEAAAGKNLGVRFGVEGNFSGPSFPAVPEMWFDNLTVKVTTTASIALENADFASPAVTGKTTTMPTGWTLTNPFPGEGGNTAGLVRPPGGDITEDLGGKQYLLIDNAHVSVQGDPWDQPTIVESGVVAKAVPGKRYVFFARFRDYGSMGWGGSGPKMRFKVGSQVHGAYADIIAMKSWSNAEFGALYAYGPFSEAQAGEEVRLQIDVWGQQSSVVAHPAIYITDLALGVQ